MDQSAVFRHAQALQQARSYGELGRVAAEAVRKLTRYRHSWLALVEPDAPDFARIVQVGGDLSEIILEKCPRVPIAGDAMMMEIIERQGVVVVLDAPNDPRTNKAIVAQLGNRTIINVPMALGQYVVGTLGTGTFGDEGVLPPTQDELDALVVFSVQLAAAVERVRSQERQQRIEQERTQLALRLESLQRVEMMGLLASGVAHDLNNLLTVAETNLALLEEAPDPEAVADTRLALARGRDICLQLLALGREQKRAHEALDLDSHVAETIRLLKPSLPPSVKVVYHPGPHPAVKGDAVQLGQALANLLLNARDAVGERGEIDVETAEVLFDENVSARPGWARPGRFVCLSVVDSGPGIPPELLPRVFDPLVTTKKNGTGLGLAVVSRVVEQHQGLLHCESRPGHTRFELYLPAA